MKCKKSVMQLDKEGFGAYNTPHKGDGVLEREASWRHFSFPSGSDLRVLDEMQQVKEECAVS